MKINSITILAASIALSILSTKASVLFDEGFNYPSGNLGGNVNPVTGNAWSSGNSGIKVTSGTLNYTDTQGSSLQNYGTNSLSVIWGGSAGSIYANFANTTSGSIYYSFLLDSTTTPTNTSATYLTAMNAASTSPNGSSDAVSLYEKAVAGGYQIGLRSGGSSQIFINTTLSAGTTYMVVMEYNFSSTMASLYLDPTLDTVNSGTSVSVAPTTAPLGISDIGFKVQSSNTNNFLIGNLTVGTTWLDVNPTPEPSDMALAGMGLVVLGFVVRRLRR